MMFKLKWEIQQKVKLALVKGNTRSIGKEKDLEQKNLNKAMIEMNPKVKLIK